MLILPVGASPVEPGRSGLVMRSYKHPSWNDRMYLVTHDPDANGIVRPDTWYYAEALEIK